MQLTPETSVLLALIVEVLMLCLLVPAVLKISQWEHTFRTKKDDQLLKIRQLRKDVKELRYVVEAVPELYALPFFKQWKHNPLRWVLPYLLKS